MFLFKRAALPLFDPDRVDELLPDLARSLAETAVRATRKREIFILIWLSADSCSSSNLCDHFACEILFLYVID